MRKFVRPLCEHPVLIFNRRCIPLLQITHSYTFLGREKAFFPYSYYSFPYKRFMRQGYASLSDKYKENGKIYYRYDYEKLSQCYVQYGDFFEFLYIVVPCRHCSICVESRRNDFVSRVAMESQMSSTAPLMITLTYEDKYLKIPEYFVEHHQLDWHYSGISGEQEPSDEVIYFVGSVRTSLRLLKFPDEVRYARLCLKDLQKFFKRFRTNCERKGLDCSRFRYVACGEYGSKTYRPHYHMILFNVPFNIQSKFDFNEIAACKSMILDSWKMCIGEACQCETARSAARYVTKYLTKTGDRRGFFVASRGRSHGDKGIGYSFLVREKSFFELYPESQQIKFVDKWSGDVVSCTLGAYSLNKVLPGYSTLLSTQYPDYLHDYQTLCTKLSVIAKIAKDWSLNRLAFDCELEASCANKTPHYCNSYFSISDLGNRFSYCGLYNEIFKGLVEPIYYDFQIDFDLVTDILYFLVNDYHQFRYYYDRRYGDIDESYFLYHQDLRDRHINALPPREVTDDLVRSCASDVRKKVALAEAKELF